MDRFDRIYALHKALSGVRHGRSLRQLAEALECDPSTAKRIIRTMRDQLGAPIVYDREWRAYRYAPEAATGPYELPGLWFTSEELFALVSSHQLLGELQPGLLDSEVAPLRQRIGRLLAQRAEPQGELTRRVRILGSAARPAPAGIFGPVARAVALRQRLSFGYHARSNDRESRREVSPQRLIHYRDSWYLDAWDHDAQGLRTFALDRIHDIDEADGRAEDVAEEALDAHLAGGYGLFAGAATAQALLRFSAHRARWVADEHWHREQTSRWLEDGRYELGFPCRISPELVGDILRHAGEVEVVSPPELRAAVHRALAQGLIDNSPSG
jgi:proteasome accessory factor C